MTTQIAIRLPDELVRFIDQLVADGRATSRAAAVSQALQRERRREVTARDAAILATGGQQDDLDGLAEHVAGVPLDDLDGSDRSISPGWTRPDPCWSSPESFPGPTSPG